MKICSRTIISFHDSIFASYKNEELMLMSCERTRGMLDKDLKSGDNIRFETIKEDESKYRIEFDRGFIVISFNDLSKLFVKPMGKSMYCSTLYTDGGEYQLYKISNEEFHKLVNGKLFKVFLDDNVYTLIDYPRDNPDKRFKEILNEDTSGIIVHHDNRFTRAICIQFEQVFP